LAQSIGRVDGVVVIKGDHMGMWGRVRLADVAVVGCEG
jgi:ribosomal protein L24